MVRGAVAIGFVGAALAAPACTRLEDGAAVADGNPTAQSSEPTESTQTTETTRLTEPSPVPAGAPCAPAEVPPVRVAAEIPDTGAPKAIVGVPDGWSMASASGGARLEGPDGMWATVTIAPTSPEPEDAFGTYTDDLTEETTVSTVSMLPADLCGYRGQRLMGVLDKTGTPDTVEYKARIVHVPTAGEAYLIAVYIEAPSGTPGFDGAATLVTGDFEIDLP
ncbi:hypothetical protein PDG61_31115 [Mycolicibacterium sp. BiH015]|uniref:hypothetical protein n=1 Tax=Mycolicibacterium sp. BiH015 TaxID=3018808 RepID=UPI0022E8EF59|nr:hypothetical protein [Mycolicibacterium sp. BiH015]MDA2895396.1 hypothetical protein [Mycolicibacterium sp. BiH015]